MKPKTADDPIVREEDAAITAENRKIAAKEKAASDAEAKKAEEAIRDLKLTERETLN